MFQITFLSKFWTDSWNLDCVTVWKICFVGMRLCTFLINQSQTVVISSQMDFRMLISIKNQFRIIIYSSINVHKGAKNFFSNVAPKTLILIFSKWTFSAFKPKPQNSTTRCRIELLRHFFFKKWLSLPPLWDTTDISKLTFLTSWMFSQIVSHILNNLDSQFANVITVIKWRTVCAKKLCRFPC